MAVSFRNYKYLFGPVPSRRLGLSLGVDILPSKTCSLDCVYCESGKTTTLTTVRKSYVDFQAVIEELKSYLSTNPELDYVTFSGCGEPTLNLDIKTIIRFLKKNFPQYKIALLTNSTLFFNDEVRNDLLEVDLVVASVDAVSKKVFGEINRPEETIQVAAFIDGLKLFRKEFLNELWLEIFVVPGVNDTDEEIRLIRQVIKEINPDNIQLNSLDRPGAEAWVPPADNKCLNAFRNKLDSGELIEAEVRPPAAESAENLDMAILSMIKRRPCTPVDMEAAFGAMSKDVDEVLNRLLCKGFICKEEMGRGVFYKSVV